MTEGINHDHECQTDCEGCKCTCTTVHRCDKNGERQEESSYEFSDALANIV